MKSSPKMASLYSQRFVSMERMEPSVTVVGMTEMPGWPVDSLDSRSLTVSCLFV